MRRKGTTKVRPTIYLDTCVIVSFIDEADANHTRAIRLVERLREERIVSRLTLLELASVYSRAGLEEPLPLTVYSVRAVGAKLVNLDFARALAFCTMTPVYLGILTLYCPKVNIATLRVTSLVGIIIGFWNMVRNFLIEPNMWWNGVLHLPLVFISICAFILSFRKTRFGETIRKTN